MANYSKLNSKKHKEIATSLLNTEVSTSEHDEPFNAPVQQSKSCSIPRPQPQTFTDAASSMSLPLGTLSQTHRSTMQITRTETNVYQRSSVSRESASGPLFGGPIYGGTFNININKHVHVKRKRTMVIESDSDSDN